MRATSYNSPPAALPFRLLLAAQLKLVTPVLQVVQRVVTSHLLRTSTQLSDKSCNKYHQTADDVQQGDN